MYVMKEDVGSAGGGGGGVGRASELLAAALKALEGHTASPPCAPTLGRTLSNIASLHARAAQAITAEGLLTSALDRLSSPYATHDCRWALAGACHCYWTCCCCRLMAALDR